MRQKSLQLHEMRRHPFTKQFFHGKGLAVHGVVFMGVPTQSAQRKGIEGITRGFSKEGIRDDSELWGSVGEGREWRQMGNT
jgi:hypothetical protein